MTFFICLRKVEIDRPIANSASKASNRGQFVVHLGNPGRAREIGAIMQELDRLVCPLAHQRPACPLVDNLVDKPPRMVRIRNLSPGALRQGTCPRVHQCLLEITRFPILTRQYPGIRFGAFSHRRRAYDVRAGTVSNVERMGNHNEVE